MDKVEAKELTKAVNSLVIAIKEQNKFLDKQNQYLREDVDALKALTTRLASVVNAIGEGGTINNK